MNLRILAVEAAVHAHATEDISRVLKALLEVFPANIRDKVEILEEKLEGHYGNPIHRIVAKVSGYYAEEAFKYILSRLSEADRSYLEATLEDRVDKNGSLYLRLNKQEAYLGRLVVYESDDVIKVVVHLEGRRGRVVRELRKLLGGAKRSG